MCGCGVCRPDSGSDDLDLIRAVTFHSIKKLGKRKRKVRWR